MNNGIKGQMTNPLATALGSRGKRYEEGQASPVPPTLRLKAMSTPPPGPTLSPVGTGRCQSGTQSPWLCFFDNYNRGIQLILGEIPGRPSSDHSRSHAATFSNE